MSGDQAEKWYMLLALSPGRIGIAWIIEYYVSNGLAVIENHWETVIDTAVENVRRTYRHPQTGVLVHPITVELGVRALRVQMIVEPMLPRLTERELMSILATGVWEID